MLKVSQLSVRIGRKQILSPVDFQLQNGETLALLGRNGAGKSTLVKGLSGLIKATGQIELDGCEFDKLSTRERSQLIGYVAQDFSSTSARMTVFEMLLLAQNSHSLRFQASNESIERASQMLAMLDLEHLSQRFPDEMSGGQRQLIALALALISRPKLLLLDEPTSALDLANQLQLLQTVKRYTRKHQICTIMVLHDLNQAHRYADKTMLLKDGQLVVQGPTAEVLTAEQIAESYGVNCEIFIGSDGARSIHPLSAVS